MPKYTALIFIPVFVALSVSATGAATDSRTAGICDRAARQAALSEGVPLDVLRAITRVETGRHRDGQVMPWPWAINLEGKGFWFNSEVEAKSFVFKVFKAGARSFDVGCFQINYRWHGHRFRSIDAMFDPAENATQAARFLKELHDELGTWSAAAGAYHSRTQSLAAKYSKRFEDALAQLGDTQLLQDENTPTAPFHTAAIPLISPAAPQRSQQAKALGSLVPVSANTGPFIALN